MKEFIEAFKALRHAPRALWLLIFAFGLDGMAYYGVLPLMKPFLGQDIGIRPALASTWVSLFTGAVTLVMLFVGKPAESRLGIRKSIILALFLALVGRAAYSTAPFFGGAALIVAALLLVGLAEGIVQPVCYAGVKRYTNAETGPMAFALLYASFNLGAMLIGPISASVRTTFDEPYKAGKSALSGFNAVNWVCVGVTAVTLVVFALFMTKRAEANVVRVEPAADTAASSGGKSPLTDVRFLFFIFALLPVRTLFAHQWLTMPEYVLRSYPPAVTDRMEWFVDSLNPLIIFFGTPTLTALTKRYHVLTMMIVGSLVSAGATFFLAGGANTAALLVYFVVFSIGEALWSSRFMEYSAELAPPGRVAQYMGAALLPWFVAKMTTGFYSGFLLEKFVPREGPQHSGTLWFIYGSIAMLSPISLFLGRKWVRAGLDARKAEEPPVAAAA